MNVFFGNASANQTNNALSFEDKATLALIRANISGANWDNVKLLDQSVSTTSNVRFNRVGINTPPGPDVLSIGGDLKANNCKATESVQLLLGAHSHTILTGSLSADRHVTLPDASIDLTQYSGPNQNVSTMGTPFFNKLGVGTAAGDESLEVGGNIKIQNSHALICKTPDSVFSSALLLDFTNKNGHGINAKSSSVSAHGNTLDFNYTDYNSGEGVRSGIALGISPLGKIGINQAAGTEALEVTGNAKITGSLLIPGAMSTFTPNGEVSGLSITKSSGARAKIANMIFIAFYARWENAVSMNPVQNAVLSCGGAIENFAYMSGTATLFVYTRDNVSLYVDYDANSGGIYFKYMNADQTTLLGDNINTTTGYIQGYATAFVST